MSSPRRSTIKRKPNVTSNKRQNLETILLRKGNINYLPLKSGRYPAYSDLIEPLLASIPSLESDDCTTNARYQDLLSKRKCLLSRLYSPLPETPEEKAQIRTLFSEAPLYQGQYGEQYKSHINNPDNAFNILTKVPKMYNAELIKEAFIQMVIINSYVERFAKEPLIYAQLIPTYGFFVCDQQTRIKNGIPISPKHQCKTLHDTLNNGTTNGQPYPFFIQEYLQPPIEKLKDFVARDTTTLEDVKEILVKIFTTLSVLQEPPYLLTHNDLHSENVLIHPTTKTVYIIDWGLASFTYNNMRYSNMLETAYRLRDIPQYNIKKDPHIISGLYDFYFILRHIAGYANDELRQQVYLIKEYAFNNVFPELKDITFITKENRRNVSHSLSTDSHLYLFLQQAEKEYAVTDNSTTANISNKNFELEKYKRWGRLHKINIDRLNHHPYLLILESIPGFFSKKFLDFILTGKFEGGRRKKNKTRKQK